MKHLFILFFMLSCGCSTQNSFKSAGFGVGEDPLAQYDLGVKFATGQGVPKNYERAIYWYRKAAEQNHVLAQYNLGYMTLNGMGVMKNSSDAFNLFKLAAQQGLSEAQYNLALMYFEGTGTEPSLQEAVEYSHKAADQGHPLAQYNLGVWYGTGRGVLKDELESFKWYLLAAKNGVPGAQMVVANRYLHGVGGIAQSKALGYAWLIMNTKTSELVYEMRSKWSKLLKPYEIKAAKIISERCLSTNFSDCG